MENNFINYLYQKIIINISFRKYLIFYIKLSVFMNILYICYSSITLLKFNDIY